MHMHFKHDVHIIHACLDTPQAWLLHKKIDLKESDDADTDDSAAASKDGQTDTWNSFLSMAGRVLPAMGAL